MEYKGAKETNEKNNYSARFECVNVLAVLYDDEYQREELR